MTADIKLANPVDLGAGRSIRPPEGWIQEGFVTDNPLWLKPKSRYSWHPRDVDSAILHWQLSEVELPQKLVSAFIEILAGPVGWIAVDELKDLHPGLIRMSLADITRAKIFSLDGSEKLLGVEYFYPDSTEFGIVHYAPTAKFERGEVQILGYEGREPEYSQYWNTAQASMATFSMK